LSNIQNHVISNISGGIYGVTGYYWGDDIAQHVVVATNDGTLYEIYWDRHTPPTPPQRLWQFPNIHSLAGFGGDDSFQHVIVFTKDGRLHELYFTTPEDVHTRSPLFSLPTTATPNHIGMAGYYDSLEKYCDVTVGGADDTLYEVVWNAQVTPYISRTTQFTLRDVAAIAGFFDANGNSWDVFVAMQGGKVYNVERGLGGIGTQLLTTSLTQLKNVAAFVNTSTQSRHVILQDVNDQVSDYTYTPEQVRMTPLITLSNVIDMAAYYSNYDGTNHVILVTSDGNVHEVYYR